MQISSRQSWRDSKDEEHPAIEWLFDVVTGKGHEEAIKQAETQPAFRIDSADAAATCSACPPRPTACSRFKDLGEEGLEKLLAAGQAPWPLPPEELKPTTRSVARDVRRRWWSSPGYWTFATPHKVFRIENDQVLDLLMLERRPGSYRYSYGGTAAADGHPVARGRPCRRHGGGPALASTR